MRPSQLHWIMLAVVLLIVIGEILFIIRQKQVVPLPEAVTDLVPGLLPGPPYPSEVFDLSRWKVTLPIPNIAEPDKPTEIKQPELATYKIDPWFVPTPDKTGIIFRAPVNAPTTGDTGYARSELREMAEDGKTEKYWPSTDGKHSLFLDQTITAVPQMKRHIVAGQIHGDDDDILVVRLEYPTLYIARGTENVATLDDRYVLGRRFAIEFAAEQGEIKVYYNQQPVPVYTLKKEFSEGYFKAGAYVQSNCETEKSSDLCDENNYGEVIIYQLIVTHE